MPKKLPEHQKTAMGEAKRAVFSSGGAEGEGQGVTDPARGRRLGRLPGQRRLAQSPRLFAGLGEEPNAPGASLPALCSKLLARLLGFFSMQKKKKKKNQMTLQPIICWLLAGCSETVTEAPLASSTPFHGPGKAGAAVSCGIRRDGNVNYF